MNLINQKSQTTKLWKSRNACTITAKNPKFIDFISGTYGMIICSQFYLTCSKILAVSVSESEPVSCQGPFLYYVRTQKWVGGPENSNFLLLYVVKMSLRRWVVQKSLKTPFRNIQMAPNIKFRLQPAKRLKPSFLSDFIFYSLTDWLEKISFSVTQCKR